MPALLNRILIVANFSEVAETTRSTSSARETSAWIARIEPPLLRTSSTTKSSAAGSRSTATIFAPSAANSRQQARPMPAPAPVMIATLSRSCTHALLTLGSGARTALLKPHATRWHQHSSIYHQRRSRNERSPITGKKRYRGCNLLWLSHPAQRVHAIACGQDFLRVSVKVGGPAQHRSVDGARANTVHANVLLRVIKRHGPHQSKQRMLGGNVSG